MSGPTHRSCDVLEVALVNNMPDQALAATQTQFARLARIGADGREIRWRCYTLPGLARSETARRYLARSHEDIETLYRRGADALIVTGCEPRAARLDHEPYWAQVQTLVDWARTHTLSTIWSCLAAHAATLHLAGVERRRSPNKISGVYAFCQTGADWIGDGAASLIAPHSRYNDLSREDLERNGFHISSWSKDVGVNMFWREEPSLFVFLQGHPEYDADTLLKEYRRDVLRYMSDPRLGYPRQPANYFSAGVAKSLEELQGRLLAGEQFSAEDALTEILSREPCAQSWADHTERLYKSWFKAIEARKETLRDSA
jgi:homoserine O-succinyltransferase/O-acetyltransferase